MDERSYVYMTGAMILGYLTVSILRKTFDPFAPVWMFLVGFIQVYIIQALSYHEYAIRVRGVEVTTTANIRSLWSVCWFLFVYQLPIGRFFSTKLPMAPTSWSPGAIKLMTPVLVLWGLAGAFLLSHDATQGGNDVSQEAFLFLQFPILLLVAAVLLIVTGRDLGQPRPMMAYCGLFLGALYVLVWMFNGKRSHSLIGVLTTICAWYCTRGRRPSFLVLGVVAVVGAVAVTLALGWRSNPKYERSPAGFVQFVGDFDPSMILININITDQNEKGSDEKKQLSHETEEYGGFLLMLDTVPFKSAYDYGSSYLRIFSTFIPRLVWPDKPYYGREEWVSAWIAGSEMKRDKTFTGPAIGILGATQLNGGAPGTVIVLAALALLLRTSYEYFRRHERTLWAQAWWSLTFYNAWLMTVNDDPFVWFYYIYGFTILPTLGFLWVYNRIKRPSLHLATSGEWSPHSVSAYPGV